MDQEINCRVWSGHRQPWSNNPCPFNPSENTFFDLYNSLSVVANTTQIQIMLGEITATGTGVMVGGYLLAFNAWRELSPKQQAKSGTRGLWT